MQRNLLAGAALALVVSCPGALAQTVPTPVLVPTPAAPANFGPPPVGKLDGSVVPASYALDLTVDPAKENFSGQATITANLKAPSRYIYLHGRDLANVSVQAISGPLTWNGTWEQVDESGTARISFPQPLAAGPVTLRFTYTATFGTGPSGLFRVHVGDQWYVWSQFESIDARAAFPSFDEPGFKTPFTVTLRTPKGLTALSNAPETATAEENGQEVHRFAPTLPLPTYLVAMMVGPFAKAESTVPATPQRAKPLPLRILSPQTNADRLSFALANSKPIVSLLEDYFGQPFPYPKLDQITSPVMPGAMENAGADLYADGLLVLDDTSPVDDKRQFGMVVAHELSHQWFGDLVTPAWWDDIWLNESFANWMGYRIGGAWRKDLNIGAGANAEGFAAMNTDALIAGRPIHQHIESNSAIDAAFDSITYGKGGHVVAMIAAFMGDERFRDGVRAYMAEHKYGNATSAEFFAAMAKVSGDPRILPAMQGFTDQQGVPLLTFARAGPGSWNVAQERYARLGTTPPATRWGVPLCVRQGTARTCQLLDGEHGTLAIKGKGPLIPNAGGTGYFRFELPREDWNALIASADHLPGNEALAVADSLRASYLAGRADVPMLVALMRRLARNPDSNASAVALSGLESLRAAELFDADAAKAYRSLVTKTYWPILRQMGFNPAAGAYSRETAEKTQRRIAVVGALTGIAKSKDVTEMLSQATANLLAGKAEALDPMWLDAGLAAWLDGKGVSGARDLFAHALSSQDPALRPAMLAAIATSGNKAIGRWVLDEARDKRLRASERLNLLRGVIASPGTRDMGYDWMQAHLDELLGGAGGIFFAARLPQSLGGFCSVERADKIATDLRPRLGKGRTALELERAIERVRDCGILSNARKASASAEMKAVK